MLLKLLFTPLIISLMLNPSDSTAQNITGTYQMKGGFEMASGFKFNPDSTFEFYFIYGAVDRSATGHYTVKDGKITLQSNKSAGKDFNIIKEEQRGGNGGINAGTTIKVTDPNDYLTRQILCLFKKDGKQDQQFTDEEGIAHSPFTDCDTIFVMHTLFPDVMTTVKKDKGPHNYFELTLNPSLAEVSFKFVELTITKEGLSCPMPYLFEGKTIIFVKEKK